MEKQITAIINECKQKASDYASAYAILVEEDAKLRKAIEIQHFTFLVNEVITNLTTAANTVTRTLAFGS